MTEAIYKGTFTKVTPADLAALAEDDIWKDPRIPNWKNENGEFLFPTVRDAINDQHLVVCIDDENRVYQWGSGMLVPPPDLGGRMYVLPEFTSSTGEAFLGRIFDPETGVLSDPPPPVPLKVSRAQALMALYNAGVLDDLEAIIAAHPYRPVRIWFENANEWLRANPYVNLLGPELGLTDDEIDDLFIAASLFV